MQTQRREGFARSGLLLLLGGISLLIVIAVVGFFTIDASNKSEATAFGNAFVADINKEAVDTGYANLSPRLKEEIGPSISWVMWATDFKRASVTISSAPETTDRVGLDVFSPEYQLNYKLSNGSSLRVTTVRSGDAWLVDNYEIVD